MRIIQKGEANRHISTTDYNKHSSRSHTIFQMVCFYNFFLLNSQYFYKYHMFSVVF